ncbi:alanine racemase [Scopulibacillus cellulosilyticus]|uniref:Alanine racemase n=1 Tax=Scopulibacillus cellulosilyticus TaxID=2665665 RepID=A0ABW2Q1U5_9BACL
MLTPYILIDEAKVRSNIEKMQKVADNKELQLRPHIKTHKMPYLAKLQQEYGASGITVAKLSEAQVMLANGIKNIFLAYPIVTKEKAELIKDINEQADTFIVGVDSLIGAKTLNAGMTGADKKLKVRIEIDSGLNRTGVTKDKAVSLAKEIVQLENLELEGIFTFKGAVYKGESTLDLEKSGEEEGSLMVGLKRELAENGIDIASVSVGSSPTAKTAANVQGVTEIRPGTYIFNDAMQVKFGLCDIDDCAARVFATVVGKYDDHLVIDGGSKTFATDVQPGHAPLNLKGFGIVVGHSNLTFARMNEEHGVLEFNGDCDLEIGDVVEIIPNHICSTVNLHNDVYLKTLDGEIKKEKVAARGHLY